MKTKTLNTHLKDTLLNPSYSRHDGRPTNLGGRRSLKYNDLHESYSLEIKTSKRTGHCCSQLPCSTSEIAQYRAFTGACKFTGEKRRFSPTLTNDTYIYIQRPTIYMLKKKKACPLSVQIYSRYPTRRFYNLKDCTVKPTQLMVLVVMNNRFSLK